MSEQTIYKYPIRVTDVQFVTVPRGARFLSAQMQGTYLVLWALVTPRESVESQQVRIVGTGHPMQREDTSDMRYLATVQDGPLVWHVFVPDTERA